MNVHPVANIFPAMTQTEIVELRDDIDIHGLLEPIWIHHECGRVIDGRHRAMACEMLLMEPDTRTWTGDEADLVAFVVSLNMRRRHMSTGQKAVAALAAEKIEGERAKERMRQGGENFGKGAKGVANLQYPIEQGKAAEKAASAFGISERSVNTAKAIERDAPDLLEEVEAGRMTLNAAKRETDGRKKQEAVRVGCQPEWTKREVELRKALEVGESVVINMSTDKSLLRWAEDKGLFVRADRRSKYGNPFVMGEDGDRDYVCDCYALYYLPHKNFDYSELEGKALGCWCAPQRCHCDSLAERANDETSD